MLKKENAKDLKWLAEYIKHQKHNNIQTDSRKIQVGDVFIPLVGENFDGHSYIAECLEQGAAYSLCARNSSFFEEKYPRLAVDIRRKIVVVEETLSAFQNLAQMYLEGLSALKIGITGSNGKTTSKELLKTAFSGVLDAGTIHATRGNFNNHIGVPITIFQQNEAHKVAIYEMGMNHSGEIALLAGIVQPQIALITNIGTAHSGNFDTADGIMLAKGELFSVLGVEGIAVINAEDTQCVKISETLECRKIRFGFDQSCDVRVQIIEQSAQGLSVVFTIKEQSHSVLLPMLGAHNALNAAAAVATVFASGYDWKKSVQALGKTVAAKGRLNFINVSERVKVLDDSYNANPDSTKAALDTLINYAGLQKNSCETLHKWAALGEMLELGDAASEEHFQIGRSVDSEKVTKLFCCGQYAESVASGAYKAGFSKTQVCIAENSEALALQIKAEILKLSRADSVLLLLKGSRGAKMEVILPFLTDLARDR